MSDAKLEKLERKLAKLTEKGKVARAKKIALKISAHKAGEKYVDPDQELMDEFVDSYCDYFFEYNKELFLPIRKLFQNRTFMDAGLQAKGGFLIKLAVDEVKGVLTFAPPEPMASFQLYNSLGFWVGIAESLMGLIVWDEGWISFAWNGGVGYTVAYSLYWALTCTDVPSLQMGALLFIATYSAFNCLLAVISLFNLFEAIFYFAKAFLCLLLLITGFNIYRPLKKSREEPTAMV